MGRWLAALKKHENADETTLQNPQKSSDPIFEGFEGSPSEPVREFSGDSDGILKVLKGPASGEIENSQPDPDAYEERAAILEYDAGLCRADAERQAAAETGHRPEPKSDAEAYLDALREIGPCGYGPVAVFLGWGAGRASAAEIELRQAGRIVYDRTGRGKPAEQ